MEKHTLCNMDGNLWMVWNSDHIYVFVSVTQEMEKKNIINNIKKRFYVRIRFSHPRIVLSLLNENTVEKVPYSNNKRVC